MRAITSGESSPARAAIDLLVPDSVMTDVDVASFESLACSEVGTDVLGFISLSFSGHRAARRMEAAKQLSDQLQRALLRVPLHENRGPIDGWGPAEGEMA